MGQGRAEIEKLESIERSKIVNLANKKFQISQQTLNPQTFKNQKMKDKKENITKKSMKGSQNWKKITYSKTAFESNKIQTPGPNPVYKIDRKEVGILISFDNTKSY
jgi:hypothetical protein